MKADGNIKIIMTSVQNFLAKIRNCMKIRVERQSPEFGAFQYSEDWKLDLFVVILRDKIN